MNYLTTVHTDVGISKGRNQDSILMEIAATDYGSILLAVVCDGMGGLAKGEVASAMVVKAFSRWFHQEFPKLLYAGVESDTLRESWTHLILEQNQKMNQYGAGCKEDMGTTMSALLLIENTYYIVQVGDSRVYWMKEKLQQLTVDQTYVQRAIELGHLTLEEAEYHPRRNVLLQCIGAGSMVQPDFYEGKYASDTVFMMCSDGFRHVITNEEFAEKLQPELLTTEDQMKEVAVYFTELNKARGERDNISVALIRTY